MLIPASWLQAEPHLASTPPPQGRQPAATDVALEQDGRLVGQAVDAQGRPLARVGIALRQEHREVARTSADDSGVFAVSGLRGGTYHITAGRAGGTFRLWAANTAPPSAMPAAMLVEDGVQVRGQNPLCCCLSNPWVLAAIVTAAIAVPIIVHNTRGSKPRTP
jgi:hypothetical protein